MSQPPDTLAPDATSGEDDSAPPDARLSDGRPVEEVPAEEAPAEITSFDRVQTRDGAPRKRSRLAFTDAAGARGAFWRAVAIVVGLAVLTAAAVWWLRREESGDADLLTRLASVAADYQPSLLTVNPQQAARYVEDASGWGIDVPELPGLQLVGVGFADLSPQASVPAFRYDGANGESAVVFAYDYVFLDSIRGSLTLGEAVYSGLAGDEAVDTRRLGDAYFVSWRRRAVIFTTVTQDEAVFERTGVGVVE